MNTRGIGRVVVTPPPAPGFMGEGHTAVPVVNPAEFLRIDPFFALMDDRIDLPPGRHAGEAHPHAGFEIATFVVDGELRDRDEGILHAGDVMWTTAGSGIVHNEDVEPVGRTRILQLWMTTPSDKRWSPPRLTRVSSSEVPERRGPGVRVRVLSGRSGDVEAPVKTYLPLTMLDIHMAARSSFVQEIPASYNGFIYVLDGKVNAATTMIDAGRVGFLAEPGLEATDALTLTAGPFGARAVLYAGERQRVPIVSHGPFIGESRADIMRVSREFIEGRLPRVSDL
jgi:redox-sensitive bicupin YhaK (pirin superfamily)